MRWALLNPIEPPFFIRILMKAKNYHNEMVMVDGGDDEDKDDGGDDEGCDGDFDGGEDNGGDDDDGGDDDGGDSDDDGGEDDGDDGGGQSEQSPDNVWEEKELAR